MPDAFLAVFSPRVFIPLADCKSLKSLGMPVRVFGAAGGFVFEQFIHRGKQNAGTMHIDADGETDFVVHEINIAPA